MPKPKPMRHPTHVLLLALLLTLPGCDRAQPGAQPSASPPADAAKAARPSDKRDETPRVPDPMKEGY